MKSNKKPLVIAGMAFFFVTLCLSVVYITFALMGGDFSSDNGNVQRKSGNIQQSSVAVCNDILLPDLYNDTMSRNNIGNLDSRAALADKLRTNSDSAMPMLSSKSENEYVNIYTLDGAIVRIDVYSGYDNLGCNRVYYINNKQLYMADFYVGTVHDKMYFSDNTMFRRTAPDGSESDNMFSDPSYCFIGNFALNEANSLIH